MANWFYFDSNGEKVGPIESAALKTLAQEGKINAETIIETETGKQAKAAGIKGLEFFQETPKTSSAHPVVIVTEQVSPKPAKAPTNTAKNSEDFRNKIKRYLLVFGLKTDTPAQRAASTGCFCGCYFPLLLMILTLLLAFCFMTFDAVFNKPVLIPNNESYTLIADDQTNKQKRSVQLLLKNRCSEEDIKKFSLAIRDAEASRFKSTFIEYYISTGIFQNSRIEDAPWAIVTFLPEMKVKIIWTSKELIDKVCREELPKGVKSNGIWDGKELKCVFRMVSDSNEKLRDRLKFQQVFEDGKVISAQLRTNGSTDSHLKYATQNPMPNDWQLGNIQIQVALKNHELTIIDDVGNVEKFPCYGGFSSW